MSVEAVCKLVAMIMRYQLPTLFVLLMLSSQRVNAADVNGDGFETILLPIAFRPGVTTPGLRDTQWQGEVWLHNAATSRAIDLQASVGCSFNECTSPYPASYEGVISQPLDSNPDGGVILTPRSDDAPFLTFANRIFEVTRHAQPQGVQIPVIREGSFLSGSSDLLGIPGGDGVRVALRIYDPRRRADTKVRVEIVDSTGAVRGSTVVFPLLPASVPVGTLRASFVAIYDLGGVFPVIKTLDRFHVRITPIGWTEFWAMASVTDNETQQVLIITPQ